MKKQKRFRHKGKWVRQRDGTWYWRWEYPLSKKKLAMQVYRRQKEMAGSIGYGCHVQQRGNKIFVYREYDR